MFCKNCGHKLKDEALFCPKCGIRVRTEASPSPAKSSASVPSPEGRQSQDTLRPAPTGKTNGKRVGLFCCLGVTGIVCVAAAAFLFLRMQDVHHAGEPSTATIAAKDTDITSAEAAEETSSSTETPKESAGVLETTGETLEAMTADDPEGSLSAAAEGETVDGQEESAAVGTIQETVQEIAQRPPMSQEELEAEVLRIRQVWQFDREAISDGTFGHAVVGDNVHVYTLDGDVRMIEIPGGDDNGFSKTFQIEDGWLTFAFYESSGSQVRLYFKEDRLFRWIQTDAGEEAVIHDQENDNVDFIQNGERALSESYAILDHLQ